MLAYLPLANSLKCFEENAKQSKKITSCPHFSLENQAVCFSQRYRILPFKKTSGDDKKESKISSLSTDNIDGGIDNDELDNNDKTIVKWQDKQEDKTNVLRFQVRGCSTIVSLGKKQHNIYTI